MCELSKSNGSRLYSEATLTMEKLVEKVLGSKFKIVMVGPFFDDV